MATPLVGVSDRVVPMRVIVCGVHRTGSMSMRAALWRLGFHDCHHMHSVLQNLADEPDLWIRALEAKFAGAGALTGADWDRLLGHCQACCDLPTAFFGPELAAAYPDAKVVVLTRDPGQWYDSVLGSVSVADRPRSLLDALARAYCYALDPQRRALMRLQKAMVRLGLRFDHASERDKALAWFDAQYREYRDRIPADRRIDYCIKDGWQPLCAHLGVPVPTVRDDDTGELVEAPFPRVNDREAFAVNRRRYLERSLARAHANALALVGGLGLAAGLGYAAYLASRTHLGLF